MPSHVFLTDLIAKLIVLDLLNAGHSTRTAPKWLLRTLALFDPSIRMILPQLGHHPEFDTSALTRALSMTFTPMTAALNRATADVT
ncbi:MAG: hypothetical protein JKY00_02750 [Roseicyclus sp.]|nr:hypothetical protein [Roseicyclus sp.]